jgi:hypothetical protein
MNARTTTKQKERNPRSFWFDPRFAIGVGLVLLSVVGVYVIVSTADTSVQVYAARAALIPGDRIDAGDLVPQSVRLGSLGGKYLLSTDVPHGGLVVTRTVAAGELVPASAVGTTEGARVASVVVAVQGDLPKGVVAGSVVDVWSAQQTDDKTFAAPSVLVSSATVVRIIESDGIIAGGKTGSVEVLVPRTKTARLLEAIANEDALSLVPVGLPAKD